MMRVDSIMNNKINLLQTLFKFLYVYKYLLITFLHYIKMICVQLITLAIWFIPVTRKTLMPID